VYFQYDFAGEGKHTVMLVNVESRQSDSAVFIGDNDSILVTVSPLQPQTTARPLLANRGNGSVYCISVRVCMTLAYCGSWLNAIELLC